MGHPTAVLTDLGPEDAVPYRSRLLVFAYSDAKKRRGRPHQNHFSMIRRRPIRRTRPYPESSLRYTTILDGAVRVYHDALGNVVREVCQNSKAGWIEYNRRIKVMLQRQERRCCLCNKPLSLGNATFEHQRRRGMGAAWRDDRITKDGQDWNGAAHWVCNGEKG